MATRVSRENPVQMTSAPVRAAAALIVCGVAMMSVSGCANGTSPDSAPVIAQSDILTEQLPSDVTARGVLLAAILLRSGDIEIAVANGTVTPAEVERARQAIVDESLDIWRQRAEKE